MHAVRGYGIERDAIYQVLMRVVFEVLAAMCELATRSLEQEKLSVATKRILCVVRLIWD